MTNNNIDNSVLFKKINDTLANIDLKTLETVRKEMLKEGKDVHLLDKAIDERKRRDDLIVSDNKGSILDLFNPPKEEDDDDLMPWEKEAMKDKEYEPQNFEEEDLEEDDYYFEDDKD